MSISGNNNYGIEILRAMRNMQKREREEEEWRVKKRRVKLVRRKRDIALPSNYKYVMHLLLACH